MMMTAQTLIPGRKRTKRKRRLVAHLLQRTGKRLVEGRLQRRQMILTRTMRRMATMMTARTLILDQMRTRRKRRPLLQPRRLAVDLLQRVRRQMTLRKMRKTVMTTAQTLTPDLKRTQRTRGGVGEGHRRKTERPRLDPRTRMTMMLPTTTAAAVRSARTHSEQSLQSTRATRTIRQISTPGQKRIPRTSTAAATTSPTSLSEKSRGRRKQKKQKRQR